jgi:hypothetical protein
VKHRCGKLGLKGSGATAKTLPHIDVEQLVLDQIAKDPASNHGVQTIQDKITFHKAIHIPQFVASYHIWLDSSDMCEGI